MEDRDLRILMVEDNARDAELAARELTRGGIRFTSRRVETEEGLRRALSEETPDVILADYSLPAFDGLAALRIVRELARNVPFIFLSGSLGEERAIDALREGAVDYIVKDRPSRLAPAVVRAIRERDAQAARAQVEAALIENERRFHYASLATRDVIFDYDLGTGSLYVNDSMRTKWRHDPSTVGGCEWWIEQIHPDDRDAVVQSFQAWIASSAERWTIEYRFRRGDGTYGHVIHRALVLRDQDGSARRITGALQDVTESRELQEQLARAARVESLGRVAATIAHEFNNVLMGIQPFAEILGRNDDPRIALFGTKIRESVSRGRRVVDEILRSTRVPDPVPATFDLREWAYEFRAELSGLAGDAIALRLEVDPGPLWVRCDREQLNQVISNLTVNARDAMPHGGTLTIGVAREGNTVLLTVADTGIGMRPDVVARIFEPLFTTKRNGTGLGLAVSHRLLRQNGASISVDSTVGAGTTFRISFALADPPLVLLPRALAMPALGPLRVLVVEDEPIVGAGIRLLLETEGMHVELVDNGRAAVPAAQRFLPDAVLLDVSLPDIAGTEVYDRLRARWPALPIVFTSGHVDASGLGDRARGEHVAFLRKPFELEILLDTLETIVSAGGIAAAQASIA